MSYVYVDILGENTRVQLYSGFFGIQILGMAEIDRIGNYVHKI